MKPAYLWMLPENQRGCHQPKDRGIPKQRDITTNQVMTVLEAIFRAEEEEGVKEWSTEEELVNQISIPQGF